LNAFTRNGVLYLSGLTAGQTWRVYTITGTLVRQGLATGDKAELALPGRGIYLITDGVKTVKAAY
jgi:hypothetical protein